MKKQDSVGFDDESDNDPFFDWLLPKLGVVIGVFVGIVVVATFYFMVPIF